MGTVIGILNTKGGVRKSTTAIHTARYLSTKGSTILIDGDFPQQTSAVWAAWRRELSNFDQLSTPSTICLRDKAVYDEGKTLSDKYDYTVIDAGGRDNYGLRCGFLLADIVIVPLGISGFDSAAMSDLITILNEAKLYNQNLTIRVFLTGIDKRIRKKDANATMAFVKDNNLTLLDTQMSQRIGYSRATDMGMTVEEVLKKKEIDNVAIAEMASFYKELDELIRVKND